MVVGVCQVVQLATTNLCGRGALLPALPPALPLPVVCPLRPPIHRSTGVCLSGNRRRRRRRRSGLAARPQRTADKLTQMLSAAAAAAAQAFASEMPQTASLPHSRTQQRKPRPNEASLQTAIFSKQSLTMSTTHYTQNKTGNNQPVYINYTSVTKIKQLATN